MSAQDDEIKHVHNSHTTKNSMLYALRASRIPILSSFRFAFGARKRVTSVITWRNKCVVGTCAASYVEARAAVDVES